MCERCTSATLRLAIADDLRLLGATFDCSAAVARTAAGRLLPVGEVGSLEMKKESINVARTVKANEFYPY